MTPPLQRRRTLLALAGLGLPAIARAQVPAQTPPTPAPSVPSVIAPPGPTPPLPTPALPATPAPAPAAPTPAAPTPGTPTAARPVGPNAIDKTKAYYVFYNQQIDIASMRALSRQLANLVEAGVEDITLAINSPGGLLAAALNTFDFITALPARINTHAQGLVLSSATVLFLAGQQRSADRDSRFLFHPAQVTVTGTLTEQQLRDQLSAFNMVGDQVAQIYRERTHLTDDDVQRFARETVIYTADQAKSFGVVQSVGDLRIPGEGKAKILFLD
jgi:ATP-dependent protease ClpP protease subunit